MLYAILCYASEDVVCSWSKEQDDAVMEKLLGVQEKYARAGRLGPVARLLPTTAATTLRKVKGESVVIDGPFAETKEQFLGFYTLECADLDEAVDFARELSELNPSGGSYEIRPVSLFNPAKVSA
ncbi:MAG: YciI family protein [Mesorhizobium sp.]|uniref:YciI family protein n=1 Tax=Mesorhizobium sp. TaxID=1871066 RepID=UPI000FE75AF7|nr:YciI family protein [Mesorhizobium sp.]RWB06431.1 MAG: YciI family protein [Mesorhizobium sp.]RWO06820.1 MAG: YciI family protein [Mesorhizobium sp.]RWP22779.1 MAG: YciI family protein [Mesorhizobium sp.]RWP31034.1 MAG: YciI family protein [Mesorhizobium sp.]RWP94820.1 MAG: YciI family protein [Mesorhizobium sp.]